MHFQISPRRIEGFLKHTNKKNSVTFGGGVRAQVGLKPHCFRQMVAQPCASSARSRSGEHCGVSRTARGSVNICRRLGRCAGSLGLTYPSLLRFSSSSRAFFFGETTPLALAGPTGPWGHADDRARPSQRLQREAAAGRGRLPPWFPTVWTCLHMTDIPHDMRDIPDICLISQ